jgi:hypothetical protein
MTTPKPSERREWPISDIDKLDRELNIRIHKLSAGRATASEISEATRLIRQRADSMMPSTFSRVRRHGSV